MLVDSGFARREVEWIVPSRTLSHRRRNGRPLTANETGCFLRTVKIWAMARAVFGDSERALVWLRKPRRSFGGISAMELLRTEAGGQVVEETLAGLRPSKKHGRLTASEMQPDCEPKPRSRRLGESPCGDSIENAGAFSRRRHRTLLSCSVRRCSRTLGQLDAGYFA